MIHGDVVQRQNTLPLGRETGGSTPSVATNFGARVSTRGASPRAESTAAAPPRMGDPMAECAYAGGLPIRPGDGLTPGTKPGVKDPKRIIFFGL